MSDLVIGLVGAIIAFGVSAVVAWWYGRRIHRSNASYLDERDASILEMRHEAAEDRETNRRLRHELAVKTPTHLLEAATAAEMERDGAVSERDQALEQLDLVQRDLAAAKSRLTEQDAKLHRYRDALQEIRESLEAQGERGLQQTAGAVLDTGELPIKAELDPPEDSVLAMMAADESEPADGGFDEEIDGTTPQPADLGAGD